MHLFNMATSGFPEKWDDESMSIHVGPGPEAQRPRGPEAKVMLFCRCPSFNHHFIIIVQ